MLYSTIFTALTGAIIVSAAPKWPIKTNTTDVNPFLGKNYFANSFYAGELNQTIAAFLAKNDTLNAARTRTVQNTGTFFWVTSVAGLVNIDNAVKEARAEQKRTKQKQIVQLVLYDLPDRDCSGGESGGEFRSLDNGLELYKHTFVDPYAAAVRAALDLTFAIILEPDSLGNVITNQNVPFCANATTVYEEGIAYAISKLQAKNVHLYIDAAHGGWLGWDDNLPKAAAEFAKVLSLAQTLRNGSQIRGFATDVSNFNPYIANPRANYTQWSNSFDELNYAQSLTPHLINSSPPLPAHFIIDQGRSGLQNTRADWGEWCNARAGFGIRPTTETGSELVDSIVWGKPGGESDGKCGVVIDGKGAPGAGVWWNEYAMELVRNAEPPLKPTWTRAGHA